MGALSEDPVCEAVLALLAARAEGLTICPSEVARMLADDEQAWRDVMPAVHAAVDHLIADGSVQLSWKGESLETREGPYRIARKGDD